MKTAEFKVGDRVKLKDGLIKGNVYGGLTMSKFMFFSGYKTIINIKFSGSCYIDDWSYSPEMLTL